MYSSKKAQISDTMAWMVATIIIVLLLLIPIFLIKLNVLGNNNIYFSREQDPVSAKSISGYLLKNYEPVIKQGVGSGDFSLVEHSVYPFLLSLSREKNVEGWNFAVSVGDEEVYKNVTYSVLLQPRWFEEKYYLDDSGKKIAIEFWLEGQIYERETLGAVVPK